jgi:multiple sugar transport system substrate-binding protein
MRVRTILLAAALVLVPLAARGADLVVWWEKGFYPGEDEAVRELVAAFEHKTGKRIELVQHSQVELPMLAQAAVEAGLPPDFLWGFGPTTNKADQWAYEDRLADLAEPMGPLRELFDADALDQATLLNGRTGRSALYVLPMGRLTNHVHVWRNLLEGAGFTLADIPKEWEAFWSFWCDKVQPAVRRSTGRDDIWGVGLAMSVEAVDTASELEQFAWAYTPYWPLPAGWSLAHTPAARAIYIQALEAYAAIHKKGCTPPDAVSWTSVDNNKAFLEQRVVMVPNSSLSIPNALREARPDDYYKNVVTIEWPKNSFGGPLVMVGALSRAVVFKGGKNTALAEEFVRFLIADGWLAHWLNFARDRLLPPMRGLLDRPFWLDPSDPHRQRSAVQTLMQPHYYAWWGIPKDQERVFGTAEPPIYETAVHRVAIEGISPEQAADEAIARIKQLLSE